MRFIDEITLNRLNFKNLISRVQVLSPYGKEKLNSIKNYSKGQEEELRKEFNRMKKIIDFISNKKSEISKIESIIHRLKYLIPIFKNINEGMILDTVDLFEIKAQIILIQDLRRIIIENKDYLEEFILENLEEVEKILDPNNEKVATFYIYESYSIILKEIRKLKKEIENRLFAESDYDKLMELKQERLSILVDEEKEEFKIRKNLTNTIAKFSDNILYNIEKIAMLDLMIGKSKFAMEYGGNIPEVIETNEIYLEDAVNIEVREILEKSGKKYTPISIKLLSGITVITGANMGGKSVALKTITENILLFHMGFFPISKVARIPLLDFVFFISDDMQDISKGLSTFGAEIIKLKEIDTFLKNGIGFVVFDEFARGTNPKEGQKFVKALAKYLNKKDSISLITTHFDSVVEKNMRHYQVVGLKNLDFDELKTKMNVNSNSMETIQKYMDFNLEESRDTEVPKDALNIAKLIGLNDEISEMIYKEYLNMEED